MGPLTVSAIIAGAVALSSDILVSGLTYTFMNKTKHHPKEIQPDPIKEVLKPRGEYAKLLDKI